MNDDAVTVEVDEEEAEWLEREEAGECQVCGDTLASDDAGLWLGEPTTCSRCRNLLGGD